ncbi:hypothetical protein Tco_0550691 [Tanacetum coccineum]
MCDLPRVSQSTPRDSVSSMRPTPLLLWLSYEDLSVGHPNRDKVDWWVVSKVRPKSFIDLSGDNVALQDDEVNTHSLDGVDTDDSDDASLRDNFD